MIDPSFPSLHIRPAKGWINDPNGVGKVDGRWHVFFQYNPNEPRHRNVHWGHWSSADLLHWQEHSIALRPRPGEIDEIGCWSGALLIDDGVPTLCYTATPDEPANAVGTIAVGDATLENWTPATEPSAPPAGSYPDETRDPYPFEFQGKRYIAQGFGQAGAVGKVLSYDATDLHKWRELGVLLSADDPRTGLPHADIWECPNLLPVDDMWVLFVSLLIPGTKIAQPVRWITGDLVDSDQGPKFVPFANGVLDLGDGFYAPQAAVDDEGRALLWGWSWEIDRDDAWLDAHGWSGALTTPRELHVRDGQLVVEPISEFTQLRAGQLGANWSISQAAAFEVNAEDAATLRCSDVEGGRDHIDIPAGGRVLVDGSLVELFVDGTSYTTRIYPTAEVTWQIEGAASAVELRLD